MTQSRIVQVLTDLARLGATDEALAELSTVDLAALGSSWELWRRPNQEIPPSIELSDPPPDGKPWPLWGRTRPGRHWRFGAFIGGRGTGKTTPIARYVHEMATTMQWPRILLMAQSDEKATEIFVEAANGLVRGSPPWERPVHQAGPGGKGQRLYWPSGAVGVITSAGSKLPRGTEFHGAWCTEVMDWPHATRAEAWANVILATRAGDVGQILVDSTPRAGNPIIADIKGMAEVDAKVWWVRHRPGDNRLHLVEGYEDDIRARYGGTFLEQEEIEGTEGDERGMVRMADIEAARRHKPSSMTRSIVILDPAVTDYTEGKTDPIGLVVMGKGHDAQLYVTEDRSGLIAPEGEGCWPQLAVRLYIDHKADCMVIETNRGGRLSAALVRTWAAELGWNVVLVELEARTRRVPGTIYVKEVYAREDKPMRFELGAQLYRDHRVSHVIEADLDRLEGTLTTWYPRKRGAQSPGDLDCVAWGCVELEEHYRQLRGATGAGQQLATAAARAKHQADRSPVRQLHPQSQQQRHRRRGGWRASDL